MYGPGSNVHNVQRITQPTKVATNRMRKVKAIWDVDYCFRNVFKKTSYKGCQREIMDAAIEGLDICAVAPTGLGKSLCFQVPAVAEDHGITIVITPLLALMRNQVSALLSYGIETAAWCSDTPEDEQKEITKDLQCGNPKLRLLYITPERVQTPRFKSLLQKVYKNNELARFVVDEAHCISTWGSNFRPAYRKLGELRDMCPTVPIMALTASAKQSMVEDMNRSLKLDPENLFQVIHSFNRRNLYYEVRYAPDSTEQKIDEIIEFVSDSFRKKQMASAASRGEQPPPFSDEELKKAIKSVSIAGIVYCRSRESCEVVANSLRSKGLYARPFHKGRKQSDLDLWQSQWINCERLATQKYPRVDIMVATVAFGMGIDKSQCRFVIHFDLPTSFEGFYQETGRAGRDGQASRCILYYSREDAEKIKFLSSGRKNEDNYEAIMQSANALIEYCEADEFCRHVLICRYFGEKAEQSHKEEYCNRMCDVCKTMERNKSVLAPVEFIATQRQRLQDEATMEYQDQDLPADSVIDETVFISDSDNDSNDSNSSKNMQQSSNPESIPVHKKHTNRLFFSSDGEDGEEEGSENNEDFTLPPPIDKSENNGKVITNQADELMVMDSADEFDTNDIGEKAFKSTKRVLTDIDTEVPRPSKEEIDSFTPQPMKYSNPIGLELRKETAAYLYRTLKVCLFKRQDNERRQIWQLLGYKHSVDSNGYPWIHTAAVELESDVFWRSKSENGYRDLSASYLKALNGLGELQTWDSIVDRNDEDDGAIVSDILERQKDLISTMRRSITLTIK